jgi:hypothetical protein
MKRSIILPSLVIAFVALSPAGVALADNAHNGNTVNGGTSTGQPTQSLEANPPGPPGFSSGGFANADTHYAGNGTRPAAANPSPKAVSQYDVAAFEFAHRGP